MTPPIGVLMKEIRLDTEEKGACWVAKGKFTEPLSCPRSSYPGVPSCIQGGRAATLRCDQVAP